MTSKEALVELISEAKSLNRNDSRLVFLKNEIKKDLEVLEIIKKWSFIQNNYKEGYGTFTQFLCNIHTIGMKEDFEKIKEWLNGR